jgi:MFS family permease
VAFWLLSYLPNVFDAIWLTSFIFALLGVTVLWLFVPKPAGPLVLGESGCSLSSALGLLNSKKFVTLVVCGLLLTLTTISDGFFYLQLQEQGGAPSGRFPLFYALTAVFYMTLSLPAGRIADRYGRTNVFLCGYGILALAYLLVKVIPTISASMQIMFLGMLGLYYAATEGVLMAMASAVVPQALRASGLAILATVIGLGKLGSAVLFGWLWQAYGSKAALTYFAAGLVVALAAAAATLYVGGDERVES